MVSRCGKGAIEDNGQHQTDGCCKEHGPAGDRRSRRTVRQRRWLAVRCDCLWQVYFLEFLSNNSPMETHSPWQYLSALGARCSKYCTPGES